jgi:hypothetical protein
MGHQFDSEFFGPGHADPPATLKAKPMPIEPITVPTTVHVPAERVIDLICTGAEGGMSNSWCRSMDSEIKGSPDLSRIPESWHDFPRYFAPFVGGVIVFDAESPTSHDRRKVRRVGRFAVSVALRLMAAEYPQHFGDFMADNEDAITGDVFLQLCVYGEVIFG